MEEEIINIWYIYYYKRHDWTIIYGSSLRMKAVAVSRPGNYHLCITEILVYLLLQKTIIYDRH